VDENPHNQSFRESKTTSLEREPFIAILGSDAVKLISWSCNDFAEARRVELEDLGVISPRLQQLTALGMNLVTMCSQKDVRPMALNTLTRTSERE
jgi:hypothetical protein